MKSTTSVLPMTRSALSPAPRAWLRPALTRCLLGLSALAAFSGQTALAQYADWSASPPKILPNERIGSGAAWSIGTGRQFPNFSALAALTADGSIVSWGPNGNGGSGAPAGNGYTVLCSSSAGFAAIAADGSLRSWGTNGASSPPPAGIGFREIYSAGFSFSALKSDGSVVGWGDSDDFPYPAPSDKGYTAIVAGASTYAGLKADGAITCWGIKNTAPAGTGYTQVSANSGAFAALRGDGTICAWGNPVFGGSSTSGTSQFGAPYTGAPGGTGFTALYANPQAFAALGPDGSIASWGSYIGGGSNAPTGTGYTNICSNEMAFAALKAGGYIVAWGQAGEGGSGAPTGGGYTAVVSTLKAFAALKADGSISVWGHATFGGSSSDSGSDIIGAPGDAGYVAIYANSNAFAALKADGTIRVWGSAAFGGSGAPGGSGFTKVHSAAAAFAAQKADGSLQVWGSPSQGGSSTSGTSLFGAPYTGAPGGPGYRVQSAFYQPSGPGVATALGVVTPTTAVLGGSVTSDAGKTLTGRGVVYATSATNANPEIGGSGVTQLTESPAGTLGSFSFPLGGLTANTAYAFKAYVTDADGGIYYSSFEVFSTNQAPLITSNGGGSSALVSLVENDTVATTVLASDGDLPAQTLSYRIAGGADAAKFRINSGTGVLEFVSAPDFETAGDVGADNRYELTVEVSDNGNFIKSASQTLAITVINLAEPALVNAATVSGLAITGATLGGTVVNDGGSGTITERGMVYALTSQNSNPQIGGSGVAKLTVAGTTGAFSRGLSGLTAGSAYTFKVYATNANGTVYSSAVNFTTLGTNAAPGVFYDIPVVLSTAVAVSFAPVQIGSAVADGPYLQVSNFAGSGTAGATDATGTGATLRQPTGATVDAAGNVYVADCGNHKIRKITPQGVVTTLAGDGYEFLFYGRLKNASGTAASFNFPTDLAVDPAAQYLYVADKANDVIRRISLTSPYAVTTFAGSSGGMVDSATGTSAKFNNPEGIAVDPTGTYLYVTDRKNHRIRKITIATAAVATLAGSGSAGTADHANSLSATFNEPTGIAVDAAGHVYVTDFGGNKVRKIAVTAGVAGAVTSLGGSGTFSGPYGVDVDGAGNVYVTEQTGHLIRMISASGTVSTLAGVSGTAGSAEGIGPAATFNQPSGIAIHPSGVAYITHYAGSATGNKIRKINLAGYRLTGTLAAGLSFNATTGVISGTPTGAHAPLSFTVSAWNYLGSSSTTLNFAISFDPAFTTAGQPLLAANGFVAGGGVLGDLSLGFVPAPGAILTLVNNTGSSAVSGIFAGLPEGSVLATTAAGETFHFRISYLGGTGNDITLTRSAGPGQVAQSAGTFTPILTTGEVSALSLTTATLNGTVNPNGFITTARFEYGKTTSYGSTVAVTLADPANPTAQAVSAALVELTAGTRYYYRLTASNVDGTSQTVDGTFWTDSLPSLMTILYSTTITATSASLGGIVAGGSLITGRGVVYAEVGVNADPRIGGAGVTQVSQTGTYGPFTTAVSGLTPATAYCFRAYAINAYGLTYSDTGTFTSGAPILPGAVTLLDNTAGGTTGVSNSGNGMSSGGRWGIAFTTGTKAYQLSSMRTAFFHNLGALSVSLYAVDSGQQTVGEAIFTKTYAPQQFDTVAYYTWALPAVELAPDTSYMLVLGCVSGSINWMTNGVAPTSTAGFVFKSSYVTSPGQAWSAAGVRFALSLTGTPPPAAPTLAAAPISAHVTASSATLGGEVTADGGAAVTERGVVYAATATNPAPEIGGAGVTRLPAVGTTGTFYLEVGSLAPETAYSFRAYATNSLGTSYSEVGTFTTQPGVTRTHQQEWRFANFGAYDSANSGADAADPDGDGLNNLLEYALGLDPNTAGVMPAVLVLNGANLEYTYSRSTAAKDNGINDQIEWSDTLETGSWSRETVVQQITSTQGALETVKASLPAGSGGKRFLRLRVAAGN
ncbi:putative Ig domain-containing protein [bacterium]|nr:putative Ig domain-containing protein [bacterium]